MQRQYKQFSSVLFSGEKPAVSAKTLPHQGECPQNTPTKLSDSHPSTGQKHFILVVFSHEGKKPKMFSPLIICKLVATEILVCHVILILLVFRAKVSHAFTDQSMCYSTPEDAAGTFFTCSVKSPFQLHFHNIFGRIKKYQLWQREGFKYRGIVSSKHLGSSRLVSSTIDSCQNIHVCKYLMNIVF